MTITIDTAKKTLHTVEDDGTARSFDLHSQESFRLISQLWLKTGWAQKYSYNFTWLGRPVIQLPEDLIRVQEVIWKVRPDVIVETGVAHGGSSVFLASLLQLLSDGRLISIDIEIRPQNREAIQNHFLADRITLIERSSIDPLTVAQVRSLLHPEDTVLVVLDSCHTKAHVLRELEMYSPLVTPGSYIIAADGIMQDLYDVQGGKAEWVTDNPLGAIKEFLVSHPEFEIDPAPTRLGVTYWPDAFLQKK